jgi:hypothetical protein
MRKGNTRGRIARADGRLERSARRIKCLERDMKGVVSLLFSILYISTTETTFVDTNSAEVGREDTLHTLFFGGQAWL